MHWLEVPTQRLLYVEPGEIGAQFERCEGGGDTLYKRTKDGKVFRLAPLQPREAAIRAVLLLEEV